MSFYALVYWNRTESCDCKLNNKRFNAENSQSRILSGCLEPVFESLYQKIEIRIVREALTHNL